MQLMLGCVTYGAMSEYAQLLLEKDIVGEV